MTSPLHRAAHLCVAFALLAGSSPVSASADSESPQRHALRALAEAIAYGEAKEHPLVATDLGLSAEDGLLDTPSAAENAHDLAAIRAWEAELAAIPTAGLPLVDRDDAKLLRAQLIGDERSYTVYKTYEKDYSAPAQAIVNGIFSQFQHLPVVDANGATSADVATAWDKIVSRLTAAPAYIAAGESLVNHPGRLYNTVGSEELAGAPDFLNGALSDTAKAQLPPEKYAAFVTARDATVASIAAAKKYIDTHAAAWPKTMRWVAPRTTRCCATKNCSRSIPRMSNAWQATNSRMGGSSRIGSSASRRNEARRSDRRAAAGSRPAVRHSWATIATASRNYARSSPTITWSTCRIGSVRSTWWRRRNFCNPSRPVPSMNSPQLFNKDTTGFYFITPPTSLTDAAKRLDPNQDFDKDRILETAAHEAMPGHFLQLSIAKRNPDFVRKTQHSGVFAEGWAFYGEEMFWQLGLYGDQDLDARYDAAQWERVRGARAIVDPELASGDWTYDRAVKFFADQTGFPEDQAKEAVAGIALGPGYVISYTVGRFQLETLFGDYTSKMGSKGSMLDFHDRLMCYGTTPFTVVAPELMADLDKPLAEVRAAANY